MSCSLSILPWQAVFEQQLEAIESISKNYSSYLKPTYVLTFFVKWVVPLLPFQKGTLSELIVKNVFFYKSVVPGIITLNSLYLGQRNIMEIRGFLLLIKVFCSFLFWSFVYKLLSPYQDPGCYLSYITN